MLLNNAQGADANADAMTEPAASKPDREIIVLSARYRAPLISFFFRRLGDRSDAEDLTQEVFVRIVRHRELLTAEVGDGFIFTVAANVLRDFRRRGRARRRSAHFSLDPLDDGVSTEAKLAAVEEISPERVLLGRESLARALRALDELNPRARDVLLMFHFEGMRQREIATLLGVSVSAVEKHVVKALAHLAARLDQP